MTNWKMFVDLYWDEFREDYVWREHRFQSAGSGPDAIVLFFKFLEDRGYEIPGKNGVKT